jgi:RimJ/RimL family protein N-acetyltransferase
MNKLIDFSPTHLLNFDPRSSEDNIMKDILHSNKLDTVRIFTLIFQDIVVGILGCKHLRTGVAELWLVLDSKVDSYKKTFHRFCRNTLKKFAKDFDIYRLQIAVDTGISRNYKWAEHLGFEEEGIMRKYDGERDHYLMARLF